MLIKDLVNCINKHLPSIDEIIHKYNKAKLNIDESKAKKYQEEQLIVYNDKTVLSGSDPITELIERTNISSIGIGSINFYIQLEIKDQNLLEFGSYNDFYRLVFIRDTFQVGYYSDESDDIEIITPNVEDFIIFLCEYCKINRNVTYEVEFNKDDSNNELNKLITRGFSKRFINELI